MRVIALVTSSRAVEAVSSGAGGQKYRLGSLIASASLLQYVLLLVVMVFVDIAGVVIVVLLGLHLRLVN